MKWFVLLFFSSCAYFSPNKVVPNKDLSEMDYKELKTHLEKTESMAGKTFFITATPLTQKYAKEKLLNENENVSFKKLNKELMTMMEDQKTCFDLKFLIDRPGKKEAAKIENWEGYAVDGNGRIHFLNWKSKEDHIKEEPSKNYFGESVAYLNEALACTDEIKIDDGLTLNLYLKKKLAPWPFSEKVSLNWAPIKFKVNEKGNLEYIEPPKKIKKSYRGW